MTSYQPPFTLTSDIVSLVAAIAEQVGRLSAQAGAGLDLRLRRINRIRTVTGSLAIEGNTLTEEQITALLDGKPVLAPPRELQEARNALAVYEQLTSWDGLSEGDLLAAHRLLMQGLLDAPGRYREGGVGVMADGAVLHMAPPASQVPRLMAQLFDWLTSREHPLIASSVFHYEFEFIHPFADGNGRMGRLWQTLLLSRWQPALAWLPVESLIHRRQSGYYEALNASTRATDCAPFIRFMLGCIHEALRQLTPQDTPQVTPQVVALLKVLDREPLSRDALQRVLGLSDRKSFRRSWLAPALTAGLVEMTLPDTPNSRLQRYRLTSKGRSWLQAHEERD